jgi:hypothetical protein
MIPSSTSRWALSSTRKLPIHRDGYWKRVTGSSSYGRREREEGRRLPSPQQFGDVLKRLLNFRRPGRHDQVIILSVTVETTPAINSLFYYTMRIL